MICVYTDGHVSGGKNGGNGATDSFRRTARRHRFVRIGKKSDDQTAEEYSDGPDTKRIPPGALYAKKRKHRFVRIGKKSDAA